jgi:hypothetical protein
MKARWHLVVLGMLLGIALAAIYGFVYKPLTIALHDMARGSDAEQSNNLANHLMSRFPFFKVGDFDNPGNIRVQPKHNAQRLSLYGVTNSESQEEIISAVRGWQGTNRSVEEISIRFYDRVNGRSPYGEVLPKEPFCVVSVEIRQ